MAGDRVPLYARERGTARTQEALASAADTATCVTDAYTGRAARTIRTPFVSELETELSEPLPFSLQGAWTRPIHAAAAQRGDTTRMLLLAGQAASLSRELPAAELVATLAREVEQILGGGQPVPDWRAVISTNQFKNGNHIEVDGTVFKVLEFQHVKPGKGGAFVRTKLRRAADGAVIDRTFRAGEKFRAVRTESRKMQFLYADGTDAHFMDAESYEQLAIPEDACATRCAGRGPRTPSTCCSSTSARPTSPCPAPSTSRSPRPSRACAATPPRAAATSRPRSRRAPPCSVPLFVNVGDRVRVDTRSGEYVARA